MIVCAISLNQEVLEPLGREGRSSNERSAKVQ